MENQFTVNSTVKGGTIGSYMNRLIVVAVAVVAVDFRGVASLPNLFEYIGIVQIRSILMRFAQFNSTSIKTIEYVYAAMQKMSPMMMAGVQSFTTPLSTTSDMEGVPRPWSFSAALRTKRNETKHATALNISNHQPRRWMEMDFVLIHSFVCYLHIF